MAGKIITKRQQQHIAGALTGMIATLDAAGMHWTKEVTDDLKLAYQMLGMPCPFEIKAVLGSSDRTTKRGQAAYCTEVV